MLLAYLHPVFPWEGNSPDLGASVVTLVFIALVFLSPFLLVYLAYRVIRRLLAKEVPGGGEVPSAGRRNAGVLARAVGAGIVAELLTPLPMLAGAERLSFLLNLPGTLAGSLFTMPLSVLVALLTQVALFSTLMFVYLRVMREVRR